MTVLPASVTGPPKCAFQHQHFCTIVNVATERRVRDRFDILGHAPPGSLYESWTRNLSTNFTYQDKPVSSTLLGSFQRTQYLHINIPN